MTTLDYTRVADTIFSYENFVKSGAEFLVGRVDEWGNDAVASSAELGKTDASLSGVAIGPGSDIDRAVVRYSLPIGIRKGVLTTQLRQVVGLRVNHPIIGSIIGPDVIIYSTFSSDYATGVFYADTFFKEEDNEESPFGVGLPKQVFTAPTLELVIANTGTRLPRGWGGPRNPKYFDGDYKASELSVGVETIARVVPVFGRKRAVVVWHASTVAPNDPDIFSARVAGAYPGHSAHRLLEKQLAPGAYPASNVFSSPGRVTFKLELNSLCSFLVLYIEKIQEANTSSLEYNIVIYDE